MADESAANNTAPSTSPEQGAAQAPPPQAPPQSMDVNAPPADQVATQDAQTPQSIPNQDAGEAPTSGAAGQLPHDNLAVKIYHGIMGALGGTQDTSYARDPSTGKMVVTQTASGPGSQWKRIIAGAVQGTAAGLGAAPGPGQLERAAGAGLNASMQGAQQADQQKRDQADQDFTAQQKTTMQKAQTQLLTYQGAEAAFHLSRAQVDAKMQDSDRENSFVHMIQSGGNGSQDLGVAKSFQDVLQMHKDMPNLMKENAQGNIVQVAHVNAEGKFDGTRFALVTPQWKDAKLDGDQSFYTLKPPTKPNEQPTVEKQTVKAGTMSNGDFTNAQTAASNQILTWHKDEQAKAEKAKVDAAVIAKDKAGATKDYAEANKANKEAAAVPTADNLSDSEIVKGMLDGSVDITKTASIRGNRREAYIEAAKKQDPNFNMQDYQTRLKTRQDFTGDGKASQQIQSFNTFLGHSMDLSQSVNALRNSHSPLINKPINWLKANAAGKPVISGFLAQIAADKTEFQNFLNNNHALLAQDKEEGQKLLNEDMSPAQLQGQMKQFVTTASIRMSAVNHTYYRTFGQDAPNMLDDDGKAALQHFGVPESMVYHHPTGVAPGTNQPAPGAKGGFDWNSHPVAQ